MDRSAYTKWTPRPYQALFLPLVESRAVRRAVVLLGPRRVGKTVLIHHTIQQLLRRGVHPAKVWYVSVDHPLYNGQSLESLAHLCAEASGSALRSDEVTLFLDEIQYLREWEVHLKKLVEDYPLLKCVVSGSAAAALRLKSTESGAGRFTDFLLPPLSFHEYLALKGEVDLVNPGDPDDEEDFGSTPDITALNERFVHYLNFGGYPEVVLSPEIQADPARFVKADIIDKVLLRDLPSLYGISDIQELNSLFTTLAFNTAQEVSLDELAKRSGVVKNTIKRYITYLEAAFLLKIVHRVDRSARRFQRAHAFKVYLTNPSLRAALFSIAAADDPVTGSLVETAAFAQWFHSETVLYYARWPAGEVDLVSLGPAQKVAWAAEVKWSDRARERPEEVEGLRAFCREHGLRSAVVTTRTWSGKVDQGTRLSFVPAALYCFTVGYNVVQGKRLRKEPAR